MRRERLFIASALLLAACAADACAAGPIDVPPNVRINVRGDGWTFADSRGMTLYTFDRDEGTPGKSSCSGQCAVAWPPFAAPADAKPHSEWTLITRDDQSAQWAFRGRPVYLYKLDSFAGAAFGDGADTQWHIAFRPIATPREIRIGRSVLGSVLTDSRGRTLYSSKSACEADCQKIWEPIAAPTLANEFGDWSIVTHDSGLRQWAYRGQPVYRRPGADIKAGEISGSGVSGWTVMVLEPAPPLPPWATIQASDAGELIATKDGHTVYAHDASARGRRRFDSPAALCHSDDCLDAQWVPFIAAADARFVGSWTLVTLPDGKRQWAYKGQKLFINVLDKKPGDFKGIRFGGERSWSAIMRSGEPMQGISVGG